jgi:hypothetical protein
MSFLSPIQDEQDSRMSLSIPIPNVPAHHVLQLCKYIAKFRLLEHGLMEAALGVDDLRLHVRRSTGDDNDAPEESPEAFQQRVELFVSVHLARASTSKRDHYKDTLVYQTRKNLIAEFLKATIMRKCNNNGCHA